MASISWSSVSLLILLAFPFNATLISPLLGLVALPYFLAMASDLRYCGYKRLDVLRIYGFNLMLLAGQPGRHVLLASCRASPRPRPPFARTPKVARPDRRPAVPAGRALPADRAGGLTRSTAPTVHNLTENVCYAALNVILACYAVMAFIGLRNSLVDMLDPRHLAALQARRAAPAACLGRWRRPGRGAHGGRLAGACCEAGYAEPQYQSTALAGRRGMRARCGRPPPPAPPRVRTARPGAGCPSRGALPSRLRRRGRASATAATWAQDAAARHARGRAPDLVRALRRRHADADLPVPEPLRRPGPAERARLRGRRPRSRTAPRAGAPRTR